MRQFIKALWYGLLLGLIVVFSYVTNQFIGMDRSTNSDAERLKRHERVVITLDAGNIKISSQEDEAEDMDKMSSENSEANDKMGVNTPQKTQNQDSASETVDGSKISIADKPRSSSETTTQSGQDDKDVSVGANNMDSLSSMNAAEKMENSGNKNNIKAANQEGEPEDYSSVQRPVEVKTPAKIGRVAIVVTGLGLSTKITERSITYLPNTVTLGFSVYASNLRVWVDRALTVGHEVLLSLPMEPKDFPISDPGPISLLTNNTSEKNLETLKWIMDQAFGYIGFYTETNERFTFVGKAVEPIMYNIRKNRKLLVYNNSEENFALIEKARNMGLPMIVADLVIDDVVVPDSINEQLEITERIAMNKGYAVVIAHAYPLTQDLISRWIATLDDKNIVVVPLSKIVKIKQ